MQLRSPAFADGAWIPRQFTCDGGNLSPPLEWSDPPPGTGSLALICQDPDAPGRVWGHWAAYDIGAKQRDLPSGASREAHRIGFRQGRNDFGQTGYGGPCPPHGNGPHHYEFRLIALSSPELNVQGSPTCDEVERAASRHRLAEAVLVGIYER